MSTYEKQAIRLAGYSACLIALGYVGISISFVMAGTDFPNHAEGWITYLSGNSKIWWFIIWLSIITDVMYLTVALGFYEHFKKTNNLIAILIGISFSLFTFLELATTWTKYPSLLNLVGQYNNTSNQELRSHLLSAIEATSSSIHSIVIGFYTIIIPSIGVILASYHSLRRKTLGQLTNVLGLLAGSCNIIAVLGGLIYEPIGKLVIAGSFLSLFWFGGVGLKFLQMSKHKEHSS